MTNHLPEQPRADDASAPGSEGTAPRHAAARPSGAAPRAEAAPIDPAVPVGASAPVSDSAPAVPTLGEVLAAPAEEPEAAPETPGRLDITGEWRRVSPKAVTIEFLTNALMIVVVVAVGALVGFLVDHPWPWFVGGAIVLVTLVTLAFVPRRIRSIGYLLRDDDLLFRRGIMWQRFVAVPYGRMQLVDINRGPLARAFGLAELKFVTASPATGVTIPGLPLEEAEGLRDHLVSVAESRRTGL
ncbi:PH domain-containing protein [Labedella phragmitis]|nr:PH domain-containing protein [Labedella phragmitis]